METELTSALDSDWRLAVDSIRAAAERIWARPLHRYYTDHGVGHSERIIDRLDDLTAGMMDTRRRLCSTEVFVLLAAAYLHDIGMQDERFAGGNLEEIRAHHHEQTAEMIYAVFEDPANAFPIPLVRDPAVVDAVALVAKGHRQVELADPQYDPLVHCGETLRLRLLAALLRFADALDLDHQRVDLDQMKLMNLPLESQLHWWRCYYVSGISIVDEYIRIGYRLPPGRPAYQDLIIPLVEGEVRRQLSDLEEILRADGVKVALGRPQVRLMRPVEPLPPAVEELARQRAAVQLDPLTLQRDLADVFRAEVVTGEWWQRVLLQEHSGAILALCQLDGPIDVLLAAAQLAAIRARAFARPEPGAWTAVRDRLAALLEDPSLVQADVVARVSAGRALALVGDRRRLGELVPIPAGSFLMGSNENDWMALDVEKPQHELTLPAYRIGKYPVTNAQYSRFVQATGREWQSGDQYRPEKSNCPAAEVSWYDAQAYCAWITQVWRMEGRIAVDDIVRLPSEAEWEKAARGSWPDSRDGRIYPWGSQWAETRCNSWELGVRETTPVGIFPEGASPYGCLDMAGNLMEWTISLWTEEFKYPYDPTDGRENVAARENVGRVARGGSFLDIRDDVRCACRVRNSPVASYAVVGFRVVVSKPAISGGGS
ncbi:MAG: SUMF1/EgtB/PvdO family nonheme iron enzyme [Anaerolineae bacterium]|nr:SUMF1/EgtB/PvdO family nonheme iron enzyme [Anaerolineae bacterium]